MTFHPVSCEERLFFAMDRAYEFRATFSKKFVKIDILTYTLFETTIIPFDFEYFSKMK